MAKKSRFLKNLLTTASATAVFLGAVTEAQGAAIPNLRTDDGTAPVFSNTFGSDHINSSDGKAAVFENDQSFYFTTDVNSSTVGTGGNLVIASIDTNGTLTSNAKTLTIANTTSLGSVVDFNKTGAEVTDGKQKLLKIIVSDATALTLTGTAGVTNDGTGKTTATTDNSYSALGDITIGSGADTAQLIIDAADITVNSTITGGGDDRGSIIVNADKKVNFAGTIGTTNRIKTISVLGDATFSNDIKVGANNITMDHANAIATFTTGGKVATLDNGGVIKFTTSSADSSKGVVVDTNGAITNGNAGNTAIDFNGNDGYVTVKGGGSITGKVINGAAGLRGNVVFGNGGGSITGDIGGANAAKIASVSFSNATGGKTSTVTGTITATRVTVDHANAGGVVTGLITGDIEYKAAGTLSLTAGVTGNTDFKGQDGKLSIAAAGVVTGDVDNTGLSGNGTLSFAAAGTLANGTIGASNKLKLVEAVNGNVALSAKTHRANEFKVTDAGKSSFTVANGGALDGSVTGVGKLIFAGGGAVTGAIGTDKVSLAEVKSNAANGIVALSGNAHYATKFSFGNANAIFTVANGGSLNGQVGGDAGNAGTVRFLGGGAVSGLLGKGGATLLLLDVAGAGTVDLAAGNHNVDTFQISNADGILSVLDGGSLIGNVNTTIAGRGILQFAANGSATTVGSAASLEAVQLLGAGTVTLGANEHKATNFELKDQAAILKLSTGAGSIITGNVRNKTKVDNKGILEFEGQGRVNDGFSVGLSGASLEKVKVGNGAATLPAQDHYAQSFEMANNNAALVVKDGGRLFGNITTTVGGTGKISFAGNGAIYGKIGTPATTVPPVAATGIAEVNAAGVGTVLLGNYNKATKFTLSNAGSVFLVPDGGIVEGEVEGQGGGTDGIVRFVGNGTLNGSTGNASLAKIEMVGDGDLTLSGNEHKVTSLKLGSAKSVVLLNDNVVISGPVDGADDGLGILRVAGGNSTIKDKVGNNKQIALIDLNTKNAKLTLDNNKLAGVVKADSISFTADATLELTGNESWTVTAPIVTNAASVGTVNLNTNIGVDKDVVFASTIGSVAQNQALGLLSVEAAVASNAANSIKFQDNVNIAKITFAGASNLEFAKVNGQHRISALTVGGGDVKLKITENTELLANANGSDISLGEDGKTIKDINIADGMTLAMGKGVNIFAETISANGNNGSLLFKDTSTIKAAIGLDGTRLKSITTSGDSSTTATIIGRTFVNNIAIGAGTLAINTDVLKVTTNIDATTSGTGTLKFINTGKLTVTGGNIKNLAAVEFAAGEVDLSAIDVTLGSGKKLVFSGPTSTKVSLKNSTDVGALNIQNASAAGVIHTLNVSRPNTEFTGTIGDNTHQFKISLSGGITAKAQSVNLGGAIFTTTTNGANNLEITLEGAKVGSIGESTTQRLNSVTFSQNGEVIGKTYAATINVGVGKRALFGDTVFTDQLELAGAGSTAAFSNGYSFDLTPTQTVPGQGVLEFVGNASINTDIGTIASPIEKLKFTGAAGTAATINTSSIRATLADFGNTTLKPNKSVVTMSGATLATNVELGSNQLNIAGDNLTLVGAAVVDTNIVLDSATDTLSGGNVVINKGANLNLSELSSLTLKIHDASLVTNADQTSQFTLITNNGGLNGSFDVSKATITPDNPFSKWTLQIADKSLILTQNDNTLNTLNEDIGGSEAVADDAQNVLVITESAKNLAELRSITDSDKRKEYVERLPASTVGAEVIESVTDRVTDAVGLRVVNLAGIQGNPVENRVVGAAGESGMAAGDDVRRYGVWVAPFYSKSEQKLRSNAAGYEATTFGATFGFDTRPNDDMIIGVAASLLNTEVKGKDFKSGDKTKADSVMVSIYGMQQLTDNWFTQGVATVGTNTITTNEKRITGNKTFQTASGKYTSMSLGGELLLGYNIAVGNVATVTPTFGTKFTRVNDGGYRETGTTNQNLTVNRKASNKLDVLFGIRFASGTFSVAGLMVTPEMHGFILHDLIGKNPKPDLKLEGVSTSLAPKAIKPTRTFINPGVGLNAEYNFMEYGMSYDMYVAKKYSAHQGTLKIRVNF